jgi:hypothetical protein
VVIHITYNIIVAATDLHISQTVDLKIELIKSSHTLKNKRRINFLGIKVITIRNKVMFFDCIFILNKELFWFYSLWVIVFSLNFFFWMSSITHWSNKALCHQVVQWSQYNRLGTEKIVIKHLLNWRFTNPCVHKWLQLLFMLRGAFNYIFLSWCIIFNNFMICSKCNLIIQCWQYKSYCYLVYICLWRNHVMMKLSICHQLIIVRFFFVLLYFLFLEKLLHQIKSFIFYHKITFSSPFRCDTFQ